MDLHKKQFKTEFAGKPLMMEVSRMADQADAAVLGRYGETTVLATVVMSKKDVEKDYFPLMVNYEEKFYATGRILGSRFTRREGKSSDDAVLSGRLIDRTLRPLFNQAMRREVQVVVTVLTLDHETDPDFVGLLTASTALAISSVPWGGPVAGVKVTQFADAKDFVFNPAMPDLESRKFTFDAFVAGTKERLNMIELEGDEAQESDVVTAFEKAQVEIKKLIAWQESIVKEIGKKKQDVYLALPDEQLKKQIEKFLDGRLEKAVFHPTKTEMYEHLNQLKKEMKDMLTLEGRDEKALEASDVLFEEEINDLVHEKVLKEEKRPDGRRLDEVRELHAEAGLLPRVHGSALFVRGNTQSLSVATLGAPGDQQLVENIEFTGKRRFMLHYNFPPYSVGEVGPFRGPGRREIGHGNLAHKALRALIPSQEEFPYTIRLVSEILSSNGSSSMATVCAGGLALMDAGVPLRKPAAGIAMGLMLDESGEKFKVLTDIQGPEDHHGDMDFKAAGTDSGVTAIQMDVKINGITIEMLRKTLDQARDARLHILKTITGALSAPRKELSPYAPSIISLTINPERIGELIGPGGKVINGIIEATGATSIDIEDDGRVFITAATQEIGKKALDSVQSIMKEYHVGDIVEGTVVKVLEFGAIVEFAPGHDGMIHVSELKNGFVKKVEDVVKLGDFVRAKIVKMDNGKVGLSIKQLNG
ncbi:MAG: polyribonucleotide nucleotidyltransferase [Patescibacteria group bacterium]|nr:polyribonucleotide nucleotidyltransferase [Patescibacteria group bacterium]